MRAPWGEKSAALIENRLSGPGCLFVFGSQLAAVSGPEVAYDKRVRSARGKRVDEALRTEGR